MKNAVFSSSDIRDAFVVSDTHFGHANIIRFTNRPFDDIDEMDAALVDNWNAVVRPQDLVFHLGDFTLGGIGEARKYFAQLNGDIRVLNNFWHHDKRWINHSALLVSKSGFNVKLLPPIVVLEIERPGERYPLAVVLSHYPQAEWDRKHHGAIHLFGHSHGTYSPPHGDLAADVGVDVCGYAPIMIKQAIGRFK